MKILNLLIECAYTGQQIAHNLEIPRTKIHYHLNELEKNGLIEVVRNEVKNGIIQKFYRAVAYSFAPASDLLPYATEVGDYYRQSMLEVLNRARHRVIMAPEEAFHTAGPDKREWPRIGLLKSTAAKRYRQPQTKRKGIRTMTGMSPYEFERQLKLQSDLNRKIARDSWMLGEFRKTGLRLPSLFSRKHGLEKQAYLVPEDLLKHEKPEIRLRAAEIIVGRQTHRVNRAL